METASLPENPRRRRSRPALNEVTSGHQTADGDYIPTRKQIDYVMAFMSAICEGRPSHDAEMARAVGVDRSVICRWRRAQGFQEWVTKQCTARRRGGLEQLLNRALERGLKGSIDHMEFYAKYSGEVEPGVLRAASARSGESAVAFAGYVINTLVPRPEPVALSLEMATRGRSCRRPAHRPCCQGWWSSPWSFRHRSVSTGATTELWPCGRCLS